MIDRFVSDIEFENQLFAVIVRSPVQEGTLSSIRLPALPEGYAFYSAADIPAAQMLTVFEYELPIFAAPGIAYRGQAVGILTGTDRLVLEALRKEVQPIIDPLPKDDFENQAVNFFDYPVIAKSIRSFGNSEAVLETASTAVYSSLTIKPQYPARSERLTVTVVFNGDGLDVYLPTQWPHHVRTAVAKISGFPEERIIVHPTQTGEVFNELLWYPSLLASQCAVAAVREKKTVSLSLSAEESLEALPKTPEIVIQHKSVLSETRNIAAVHIFIIVNSGSFCPLINQILKQMTAAALGPYHIPHYRIEAVALKTPQGLTDIFEGWGESFVSNALENHIGKIIQDYNFSPDEWRLEQMLQPQKALFTPLLQTLKTESNFSRKYAAYGVFNRVKNSEHDGRWRGIGLAAGFQYSGCPADFTYTLEMTLETDNKLYIKAEPAAEDLKKLLRHLTAQKMELPESEVVFTGVTTADMNLCGPATGGTTASILIPLAEQCITDLQEQRFRSPLPISVARSYRIPQPDLPLTEEDTAAAFISITPAACIVELELDPVCYEIIIHGVWFACSPGKIYERKQAASYLYKNIAVALSRTCKETLCYTEDGGIKLPQSEYRIILPNEVPETSVYIMERDTPMSALDSSAINILPAAYLAALNQILLTVPVRMEKLPVLAEDIYRVLRRDS
ncbi:MAG: molybdopterin-dependent oxidoreductase [Treponema sp.]